MGYYMRKASVHIAAMSKYQKDVSMADDWKERYISLERDSAAGALTEAIKLGDKLAGQSQQDQAVARDRILTRYYFSRLWSQLNDWNAAAVHLSEAQKLFGTLVEASPFSAAHFVDWMGLPNLDAAMGDLKTINGDHSGGKVCYEKAITLQARLVARRPWDEERTRELKRLEQLLGKTLIPEVIKQSEGEPKNSVPGSPQTNGLGMLYVPVPGANVRFSKYETRVRDYRVFIQETGYIHMRETADPDSRMWSLDWDGSSQRGYSWDNPGFNQTEDCPVVGVSWRDACAFCEWLTLREHAAGRLPADLEYRLPTDADWSMAVGLVEEDPLKSPEEKHKHPVKDRYPWGEWPTGTPLSAGAGNYAGVEAADKHWPAMYKTIQGYNDGYSRTAPVGSFKANGYGICDLGGNVWEWCETGIGPNASYRVLRGGSWGSGMDINDLLSSHRQAGKPGARYADYGFRCVLAPSFTKR
jgi:formylglycine-generating enzyme required for sulfatase activity